MVLTGPQITAFWEEAAQMGLPNATRIQLQAEGIDHPDDLVDFYKDDLKQLADNLRKPPGRAPNPDPGAAGAISTPGFTFGAMSQMKILAAANIARYHNAVGRPLTVANLQWNPVIRNFKEQWKALEDRKKQDIEAPKASSALPILKWVESFIIFTDSKIGARMIPLRYVTRAEVAVPAPPALLQGLPHSQEHGSVEQELVMRASHTHPLFPQDEATVFRDLEEALRGASYAASLKPFARGKRGRAAYLAIVNQYAGKDKWEILWKKHNELLVNNKWTGQSSYTLEKFASSHRNAFVMMQQCEAHVGHQLPNERQRVTYLIDNIECPDAPLQAAMAQVRTDSTANGPRNDFEQAVTIILPHDPVMRKRSSSGQKRKAEISSVDNDSTEAEVSGISSKPTVGRTGVEFRFYKSKDYKALTNDQKEELREYRKKHKISRGKNASGKTTTTNQSRNKAIAAAVKKELKKIQKESETNDEDEENLHNFITSVVNKEDSSSATAAAADTKKVTITKSVASILKKAKN